MENYYGNEYTDQYLYIAIGDTDDRQLLSECATCCPVDFFEYWRSYDVPLEFEEEESEEWVNVIDGECVDTPCFLDLDLDGCDHYDFILEEYCNEYGLCTIVYEEEEEEEEDEDVVCENGLCTK